MPLKSSTYTGPPPDRQQLPQELLQRGGSSGKIPDRRRPPKLMARWYQKITPCFVAKKVPHCSLTLPLVVEQVMAMYDEAAGGRRRAPCQVDEAFDEMVRRHIGDSDRRIVRGEQPPPWCLVAMSVLASGPALCRGASRR